jgi:agmatinase
MSGRAPEHPMPRRDYGGDLPYAGPGPTFAHVPLVLEPADLAGADVVVIGAPLDQATSYRPGARFGPRAIRDADIVGPPAARPNLALGVDPLAVLRVVDHGDVGSYPNTVESLHAELRTALGHVLDAGAVPVVLGGDHSVALPMAQALSARFGAHGFAVAHFDAHGDVELETDVLDHGNPFSTAIAQGHLSAANKVAIGVRGYWPTAPDELAYWGARGLRTVIMDEVVERGLGAVLDEVIERLQSRAPRVYLSVDMDVLDPAFAPGTGTPEPGGLATRELLLAVRRLARELDICALDVVEVNPMIDVAGITAGAAHAVVLEALGGMAARSTL